jgi:hypothetical protein
MEVHQESEENAEVWKDYSRGQDRPTSEIRIELQQRSEQTYLYGQLRSIGVHTYVS